MPKGLGYVRFGIDGLEDTNHLYRRNVRWPTLMRNVRAFVEAGGNAEWDFIEFRQNQHQVEQARMLADELGFSMFNVNIYRAISGFRETRIYRLDADQEL